MSEEKSYVDIRIRCTADEHKAIKAMAAKYNMSMTSYIKMIATNEDKILINDYSVMRDYTNAIYDMIFTINRYTIAVINSGNYFPNELVNINEKLDDIKDQLKELKRLIRKNNQSLLNQLKKTDQEK